MQLQAGVGVTLPSAVIAAPNAATPRSEKRSDISTALILKTAAAFFTMTLVIGLALRWDAAVGLISSHGLQWANLRHAHSHAGYYGFLTLAWWMVERESALRIERWLFLTQTLASSAAVVAFALLGYVPFTIVLSTVVAVSWLYVAIRHSRRRQPGNAWLDCALPGLCFAVLLIPGVALTARRDFALSRDLAHVFMAQMLLTVFVPAAWQARGLKRTVSPLGFACLALASSVHLIFGDPTPAVLTVATISFALVITWALISQPLSSALRAAWLLVPVSLVLHAFVPNLHGFAWRIAGLHALILGPVVSSLAGRARCDLIPAAVKGAYVSSLIVMAYSIVAPEHLWPARPLTSTAVASTVFVLSALVATGHMLVKGNHE